MNISKIAWLREIEFVMKHGSDNSSFTWLHLLWPNIILSKESEAWEQELVRHDCGGPNKPLQKNILVLALGFRISMLCWFRNVDQTGAARRSGLV